jgi:ADP-ribose pyrophosphatase YjhB (NUDIX family)
MIAFQRGNVRFGHRTAGVATHAGHVLLHRAEVDDFWSLPGGRCELLEPAARGLQREMREEMGFDVRVVRLLWAVENFFEHRGIAHHELGFYFLMDLGPDFPHYAPDETFAGSEESLRLIFRWFPIDALRTVHLYPTFLKGALRSLPTATQHVVHTDPKGLCDQLVTIT